jgi:1-phosphofructokinase family hexose kinase
VITVAGLSPSLDITYLVQSLQLGQIHRPTEVHRIAGGKSLNLARAAATIGADVGVVAVLGGATGAWIEGELATLGIAVRAVRAPDETRTCVSIASADRDDLTEVYPYAPPIPQQVWEEFRAAVTRFVDERPGWLAINGSTPQGLEPDNIAELIMLGHESGRRVAVDTHGPALEAALAARPELIKINRDEAAQWLDQDPVGVDLGEAARIVSERTGGSVIITDGRDGAVGREPDGDSFRVRLPDDVSGRYPVGSGDSFLGGWLAAVDRGADAPTALRLATGCGAANALQPGPGKLDRPVAEEIAERATVEWSASS